MEMSRYSIKPNAGKGLSGFITNLNIAGEFDPAWLDSNPIFGVLIYRLKPMRNFGSSADQPKLLIATLWMNI